MGRLASSRTRLLELNLHLDTRAQQLAEEESHFTQRVAGLAEAESNCRTKLAAHEEELKVLRNSASEAQEARGQIEVELVRRQSDLKYLDETSRKELDAPVAELAAAHLAALGGQEPAPAAPEITREALVAALLDTMAQADAEQTAADLLAAIGQAESDEEKQAAEALALEALASVERPAAPSGFVPDEMLVADAEERVAELRRKIEALGGVNPEAWREFQEAQQRYDFLNTQRQDLLDSIKDTDTAIKEIDTESRKRFAEAFEVINENFRQTFQTLFGGGTGEMRLIGEGDQLEQGIEIVAQPPGKRLQNVQLLSGGEKALTAMALLMGIFRYQPSPFCILDEVDAPLDEANVGRFTNLVKDMAAQTQFIVITHAKKTMESAETLYGVTMQEQGVSKLVSVRLQAPPPPPVAVSAQASAMPN
jgi:chromosome segregation protein